MALEFAKYGRRQGKKVATLTVAFSDLDDLKKFVVDVFPPDVVVYHGDTLDVEFGRSVPAGSYVARRKGEKPEAMRV